MLMSLDDEEFVTRMWMIVQMMTMSTMEIYIAYSICDASITPSTSNVVVYGHGVNVVAFSNEAVLDMVVEKDDRYLHNGASFLDGHGTDDDADEHINDDAMTKSDEDDGDTVTATVSSSHCTRLYDLPSGFDDGWRSGTCVNRFTPNNEFEVGQQFDKKEQVINMVSLYSIKRNQFYRVLESDKHKWVAECKRKKDHDCTWRIRGTKKHASLDMFTDVCYPRRHSVTYVGNNDNDDHVAITSDFIIRDVIDLIRTDPSLKVQTIIELLKEKYGYRVSCRRTWLGKQRVINEIFGGWEKSYSELSYFMAALQHFNMGKLCTGTHPLQVPLSVSIFIVFWAFKPSIHGFKHCRPILTIDGTHLYGEYNGTLLVAMGSNANNQLFLVAFAVCESENGHSWPLFMAFIRAFVTKRKLCVISDRHPYIIKAVNEVGSSWEEPSAQHRLCMRHLRSNVHTHFKDIHM
ncbi:unnamed protein product [Cuscuta epithymum]|uniref:MULE transposase domain-containing protein n=1 Tax=Cuscuta epithymum TaxID=186058 RepID=A0AAV0E0E1_9ASTE|nr:unnamed protein product [Cuscuta epithymum]